MLTKVDKINKKYQSLLNLIHFDLDPHLKDLQEFIESSYNVKILYIVEKIATTNFKDSGSKNSIVIYLDSKASIEQIKKRYKVLGKTTFVNDELIDQTITTRYFDLLMKRSNNQNICSSDYEITYSIELADQYNLYIHEHIYRHIFKKIKKHFKRQANIWSINEIIRGFVVFYEKDREIIRNAKSGISDEINKLFKDELAKIDYLKLYGEKYFLYDSHENLKKNYGGSLFYYNR